MSQVKITTPDGHTPILNVSFNSDGTNVTVGIGEYSGVSVSNRSNTKGDVALIESTIRDFDNLMVNLEGYKPKLVSE